MNLTDEQENAVNELTHNLQIIACAGSGKTEVITRRIAKILETNNTIKPNNIVAFTFTKKAANSMKNRILKAISNLNYSETNILDDMYIGTIHSFCYFLLSKYTQRFQNFKILDTVKNYLFVNRYYNKCGMSDLELKCSSFNIKLFLDCIDKMVDDYENNNNWTEKNKKVFEKYRECLYEHGYIDFSCLIFETIEQIKNNEEIRKYISNIKYLIVDEYQDIDDLQEKLINLFANCGTNICVVGDDDQTIYRFRGSNANNMIDFSKNYSNVVQVRLEKNFRCVNGIVDIADSVIQNNKKRIEKKMFSDKNNNNSILLARKCESTYEQYKFIVNEIIKLHKNGIAYNDIAILVRKGKFIKDITLLLDELDIPYCTDSAEYFFNGIYFERFIKTLSVLTNFSRAALYECWNEYIDENKINSGFKYLRRISTNGGTGITLTLSKIIIEFADKINFLNSNFDDIQIRIDNLQGITDILNDYDEIYKDQQLTARINGLLRFLNDQAAEQYKYHNFKTNSTIEDSVQIMTVHKSKGLEFNTVFLPNLENNEFPAKKIHGKQYWHVLGEYFEKYKVKYESDIEDERKLFYVGVTRAKQNLYLTYELSSNTLSEFVKEASSSKYLSITYSQKECNK